MSLFAYSQVVEIDVANGICKIEGVGYPLLGFGTYPLRGKICAAAVKLAVKAGYRIIDTATYYENFDGIAQGLKGQDRPQFYITSKVWHDKHSAEDLRKDLDFTLKQLHTDYLDAYLLHWPNSKISIKETLTAMEEMRQDKKIRHIGLSNVSVNHLKKALKMGIPITWVQIEMHPFFYDRDLLDFCKMHSITVQAWRPLDLGRVLEDKMLIELGEKQGKTACQVALRWITQHGCLPLPGSKSEKHIQENLDIMNFALTEEEMQKIDQRASKGTRFRLKPEHGLGFTDEFDFTETQCWPH